MHATAQQVRIFRGSYGRQSVSTTPASPRRRFSAIAIVALAASLTIPVFGQNPAGSPPGVPAPRIPITPRQPLPPQAPPASVTGSQGITLNNSTWTFIGPGPQSITGVGGNVNFNVSGRIAAIAAHPTDPDTIYIAPAGGGVWRTTNASTAGANLTWTSLTDTQATLSMGALAIAPSNPLVIYAGTGEANNAGDSNFGRGILVSTDGGATWILRQGPGNIFNRMATSAIAVSPADPNTAYAAMMYGIENGLSGTPGVYKTTDGGVTWVNTTAAIDTFDAYSDVKIDLTTPSTVYMAIGFVGGATSNGVYKSTNSGASWSKLTNGPDGSTNTNVGRISIAISKSNSSILYATTENVSTSGVLSVVRSDDGGSTFHDVTPSNNYMGGQGWYDQTIIVDPATAAIAYVAGSAGPGSILRTVNSGASWTAIDTGGAPNNTSPHVDHHGIAFDANGLLLDGDDGGIYRLDNPGVPSWTDLNGNLGTIQFQGIGLHPTDPNQVIGGSQDNGTALFGGSVVWRETDGGDGGWARFSQTDGSVVYHIAPVGSFGPAAFFRRSNDGGVTWASKTTGFVNTNTFLFYAPFVVDPGNGNRLLVGADRVYESTNAADLWSPISTPGAGGWTDTNSIGAIGLAPSDANTIYAATCCNSIFVTSNHGASWTNRPLPVAGNVSDIQVDRTTATTAYASIGNFTTGGNVFQTTNGGVTWTNISGNLPSEPVWSLQVDLDGTLYAGADDGVYTSQNGGANWNRLGAGLPNVQVFQLALNTGLHILAAATHGRGAWEIETVLPSANLTITKSHTGNFVMGQTGATYTITASNVGGVATSGTVTVTDTLPAGLTATAIAGPGWGCTLATLTCTRSDALTAGASYSSITLTVNVANNAPASVTNVANVAGGGEIYTGDDQASDPTTIISPNPDMTIVKSHSANFFPGETGATYTLTATNSGASSTSGTVTVTDTLPAGLTATAIAGSGWGCTLATLSCNRSDVLASGASYPAITLTVNVSVSAPSTVINTANVSGGGETNTGNDTATDPTTISNNPATSSISVIFPDTALAGGPDFTLSVSGSGFVSGAVVGWNGTPLSTTFSFAGFVTAAVPASLIATAGTASITVTNPGEQPSASVPFSIVNTPATPTLTSGFASYSVFTVTGLFASKLLFLSGSGFQQGATVSWNGTNLGPLNSGLNVTVPLSLIQVQDPGPAAITVANPGGAPSQPVIINVIDPRTLSGIAPATVSAGSGSFTLTVNGDSFAAGDQIAVWGSTGQSFGLTTTFVNSAQLQATVPASFAASSATLQVWVNSSAASGAFSSTNQLPLTVGTGGPVLSISKSHSGNFFLGQQNAAYTITVSNASGAGPTLATTNNQVSTLEPDGSSKVSVSPDSSPTSGPVTVSEFIPAGLTLASIAGPGWSCTLSSATCLRSDVLAGGASYPPITVTVNVSPTAVSPVTNSADVSGGGTPGDFTSDVTIIATTAGPDLTLTKSHTGNFTQGQTGAIYTINAFNVGGAATSGAVTVTDTVPAGLTATGISGAGWNCTLATVTCTRNDALASGGTYPAITLTVNVAANAPLSVTNVAQISGGGETNTGNDQASDVTTIVAANPVSISSIFPDTALVGGPAFTLSVSGTGFVSGAVVNWNGTALATTFSFAGLVTAAVPASFISTVGTASITVTNPGGSPSASRSFAIVSTPATPTLTSVFPSYGVSGITGLFAGKVLFLSGTGFELGATILWNGTNVGPISSSPLIIVPTSLMQTPGPVSITAINPGGAPSNALTFTVPPLRALTSIAPATVSAGAADFTLTVNGTGFTAGDNIGVWGSTGESFGLAATFISSTQLQTTVPASFAASDATLQVWVSTDTVGGAFASTNQLPLTVGTGGPVLNIVKTHAGNFAQGQQNAVYTITVNNQSGAGPTMATANNQVILAGPRGSSIVSDMPGSSPTTGAVTVTDFLPAGMTLVTMTGPGWNCTGLTCTRSDVLAGGASYPNITLTVNVSPTAASPLINSVSVSGGGAPTASASDVTIIGTAAATLTSIFPDTAIAGGPAFTLSANGTGFVTGAVVNWNGTPLATNFFSSNFLAAAVPASLIAAVGTASITVTNPGGSPSASKPFAIVSTPAIPVLTSEFATYSVNSTGLFANKLLLLSGTSFELGATVSWNGTNLGTIGSASPLILVPTSLMQTPGPVSITAMNPGGAASNVLTFTVPSLRTLTSIAPATVPTGTGDFTLTVNGTGFTAGDVIGVWGSTGESFALSTTFISSTQLQATVPASFAASNATLQVWASTSVPGGVFATTNQLPLTVGTGGPVLNIVKTHAGNFAQGQQNGVYTITVSNQSGAGPTMATVNNQVTLAGPNGSSIVSDAPGSSPSAGAVTVTDSLPPGMTLVTMTGPGWNCTGLTCTRSDVLAGGASYPNITLTVSVSPTAGSPLINSVTVTGGGAPNAFASDVTIIGTATATLTSIFPDTAIAGGPAFTLQVSGTGFVSGAAVNWNGAPLATSFVGPNFLTATVPASLIAAVGTAAVTVTNPGGVPSNPATFSIVTTPPVPVLTSEFVTYSWYTATGLFANKILQVTGSGFEQGVTLAWNGINLGPGIAVSVPLNLIQTPGPVSITAVNPGGTPSTALNFVVPPLRSLTSVSPATIAAGSASFTLTVNGTGFAAGDFISVWPGAFGLATTFISPTQLQATVPASAVAANGTLEVWVTTSVPGAAFSSTNELPLTVGTGGPLLSIAKTHAGNFTQGQQNAVYTVTVSNASGAGPTMATANSQVTLAGPNGSPIVSDAPGSSPTTGAVTVTDSLPPGMTLVSMAGPGWNCTGLTCTRSDVLAGGASYPDITVTVNVSPSATSPLTNFASVSGGGAPNAFASDVTIIGTGAPDMTVTKTHVGNFTQGQTGATYAITANNIGNAATSGTVTVTDTVPAGLTVTAIAGAGWGCNVATVTCTRGDVLAAGGSYPAITLTVTVAANAPATVTNTATIAGGGEINTGNDTASDPTTINPLPASITFVTNPTGLLVSVDSGAAQAAPFTTALTAGPHTIAVAPVQAGGTGMQFVFTGWSDLGAASHSITVGTSAATYTATFKTQYQLTTAASPGAGGTVTPASGTFYDAGSIVAVNATANAGYQFGAFSGALTGNTNPQNVTVNSPTTVVGNFTPLAPALAASVGARTVSGANLLVNLTLTNTGPGAANNATITSITAITDVAGTGVVTVASGVPIDLGTIHSGSSAAATVTFKWPATATRVSFTVNFTADGGYAGSTKITTLY